MTTIDYPPLFNRFESCNGIHGRTITFEELISEIKNPPNAVKQMAERAYHLRSVDKAAYDALKGNHFSVFSPNSYTTANNRSKEYIKENGRNKRSTGFIHLDFDCNTEHEAVALKKNLTGSSMVAACWTTLSRRGVAVLVKLKRCFREDHEFYWHWLNDYFDSNADRNAKGYDRLCIIPYDPNVWVNPSPVCPPGRNSSDVNYRYYAPNEECKDKPYIHVREGRRVPEPVNLFLYSKRKIKSGYRHNTLAKISQQLILLNPSVKESRILQTLQYIIRNYCEDPETLTSKELKGIVHNNYKKHQLGDLKGSMIIQYVFFKRHHGLPRSEMSRIIANCTNERNGQGRKPMAEKIYRAIEELNGQCLITKKLIAKRINVSTKTIYRYCTTEHEKTMNLYNAEFNESQGVDTVTYSTQQCDNREKEYSNDVPSASPPENMTEIDYTKIEITINDVYLGFDATMIGIRISEIADLELLIKWFNLYSKGDNDETCIALWARINQLHPKYILRFDDLASATTKQNEKDFSQSEFSGQEYKLENKITIPTKRWAA